MHACILASAMGCVHKGQVTLPSFLPSTFGSVVASQVASCNIDITGFLCLEVISLFLDCDAKVPLFSVSAKLLGKKLRFFLAFFLKITAFSYFFTLIVISTLQNDRLNRGYWLLLYVLPYLCTFAARKPSLQPFSIYVYVRVPYI